MVRKIAADRDDPAVLGLVQHHAIAPVRPAAGDHHRELAVKIGWAAAIEARGLTDPDLDPLFFRLGETKTLEPGRARRAAAGGIDHEIGRDAGLGTIADPGLHALDRRPAIVGDQLLYGAIVDHAHIRQSRQAPA